MGVVGPAAMPERTYDPVGDDDCLKVDIFLCILHSANTCCCLILTLFRVLKFWNVKERELFSFLLSSIFILIMLITNFYHYDGDQERKWWCFLLSSIFTFLLGIFSVLLVRLLQAALCKEVCPISCSNHFLGFLIIYRSLRPWERDATQKEMYGSYGHCFPSILRLYFIHLCRKLDMIDISSDTPLCL